MDWRGLWETTSKSLAEEADRIKNDVQASLRTTVSRDRNRTEAGQYNLDLTYILPNMVAMALPSESRLESAFRNGIEEVQGFLDEQHGDKYMVINVSERRYNKAWFGGRVANLGWPDHHAPDLAKLLEIMQVIESWMTAPEGEDNVVVVHCKAGKGRTGTVVTSYLLYSGLVPTVEDALEFFALRRSETGAGGVTVPSQIRYVHYLFEALKGKDWTSVFPRTLQRIVIRPVPNYDPLKGGLQLVVEVVQMQTQKVITEAASPRAKVDKAAIVDVAHSVGGDILLRFYHQPHIIPKIMMFRLQFHTGFLVGSDKLVLGKGDLDSAWSGNLKDPRIPDDFVVELQFASE